MTDSASPLDTLLRTLETHAFNEGYRTRDGDSPGIKSAHRAVNDAEAALRQEFARLTESAARLRAERDEARQQLRALSNTTEDVT